MLESLFSSRGNDLSVKPCAKRGLAPGILNLESRSVPTIGLVPSFAIVSAINAPSKQVDLPRITIGDATRFEGNRGTRIMTFQVTRSGDLSKPSSIDYSTSSDNAVAYQDYIPASGKIEFLPAQKSRTILVVLISDSKSEINKSFHVNLTSPMNAQIQRSNATGSILDDDLIKTRSLSVSIASNQSIHHTTSKTNLENGRVKVMTVQKLNIPIMPGRPGGSKIGKRPRPI